MRKERKTTNKNMKKRHKEIINQENDGEKFVKILTLIVSALTLILSIFTAIITWRNDNLAINKPDNLIVNRLNLTIDEHTEETVYSVESLENANRYSEVRITPILYIYCKDFNGTVLDEKFAYLDKLYIDTVVESEASIIAFKDLLIDGCTLDSLLRVKARYYNIQSNDKYVDCDIIYRVDFKYLNNKNTYQDGFVLLTRESTAINLVEKERLLVNQSLKERFINILKTNEIITLKTISKIDFQGFDPKNCTENPTEKYFDSISAECFEIIEEFQNKHGIIEYYTNSFESES